MRHRFGSQSLALNTAISTVHSVDANKIDHPLIGSIVRATITMWVYITILTSNFMINWTNYRPRSSVSLWLAVRLHIIPAPDGFTDLNSLPSESRGRGKQSRLPLNVLPHLMTLTNDHESKFHNPNMLAHARTHTHRQREAHTYIGWRSKLSNNARGKRLKWQRRMAQSRVGCGEENRGDEDAK